MTMAPLLDKKILRHFARAGTIGFHMVISTFVGYLIGSQLDKWLVTSPWFTITFLILASQPGSENLRASPKGYQMTNDQ